MSETAQALQRSLGQPWKLRKSTLGPQVAKVYAALPEAALAVRQGVRRPSGKG